MPPDDIDDLLKTPEGKKRLAESMALPKRCPGLDYRPWTGEQKAAQASLAAFLPHLKIACEMAKIEVPGCKVELGVIGTKPDGSGQIVARFELTEFIADLEKLL
jgi:hypothetical protein